MLDLEAIKVRLAKATQPHDVNLSQILEDGHLVAQFWECSDGHKFYCDLEDNDATECPVCGSNDIEFGNIFAIVSLEQFYPNAPTDLSECIAEIEHQRNASEVLHDATITAGRTLAEVRDQLALSQQEVERLREVEYVVRQLAVAYKGEADRYERQFGKDELIVRFTRGRQDAYENMIREFDRARQALQGGD